MDESKVRCGYQPMLPNDLPVNLNVSQDDEASQNEMSKHVCARVPSKRQTGFIDVN